MFEVDPFWPKPLPNHWLLGSTIGVSVDSRDHVWIIHRGAATLNARTEMGAATSPPTAEECCIPAPPVLEFDPAGNLVGHWGGPGAGYEWPASNHGITVDYKGNVWIGGNDDKDAHILKFTRDGKFLMQFGHQGKSTRQQRHRELRAGRQDLRRPEGQRGLRRRRLRQQARGRDRRGHRQVQALLGRLRQQARRHQTSAPTIRARRPPSSSALPVHCAELVERRARLRLRPPERSDPGVPEGRQVREGGRSSRKKTLGDGSVWDIAFSKDPQQTYLYLADGKNEKVYILDRDTLRDPDQLRRRRTPARPVLRRAQHRHRFEGQHLHDRDLRRKAPAEVRVQGPRAGRSRSRARPGPRASRK